MADWKQLAGPLRPSFLILTPVCVLLGAAVAFRMSGGVDVGLLLLVLAGALCAHISVNAFNEYADFKSGLDTLTVKTPYSGGSGVLPAHPELAPPTLALAVGSLLLAIAIGGYFLTLRGFGLLPLGVAGVVVVLTYTPWINRNAWLCLLSPGLGFGPFMVMGTAFVLTGRYSSAALAASLIPFFLVNGLLLLNQFPDVEADRHVGRSNFPIRVGRRGSSLIYGALALLAFLSLGAGVFAGVLPATALVGWAGAVITLPVFLGVYRHADDIRALLPYMGLNVLVTVITPLLVAGALLLGDRV